jgi:hypothetical protein
VKVIVCASYSISFKLEAFSADLERSKQEKEGRKKETTIQAAFARGFRFTLVPEKSLYKNFAESNTQHFQVLP